MYRDEEMLYYEGEREHFWTLNSVADAFEPLTGWRVVDF